MNPKKLEPIEFSQIIISEIHKHKENTGKEPRFLILGPEYKEKLKSEMVSKQNYKLIMDAEMLSFHGLAIVRPSIIYGGDFKWALGY